jgi:hypothetical protein
VCCPRVEFGMTQTGIISMVEALRVRNCAM